MKENVVVLGEFENKLYAEIAKKDLRAAGITANILEDDGSLFSSLSSQAEGVQLIVPDNQVEVAKEILKKKFI